MNLARLDIVRETGDEERVDVAPVSVVRVRLMIEIVRIVRLVSHRRNCRWNSRRRLVGIGPELGVGKGPTGFVKWVKVPLDCVFVFRSDSSGK